MNLDSIDDYLNDFNEAKKQKTILDFKNEKNYFYEKTEWVKKEGEKNLKKRQFFLPDAMKPPKISTEDWEEMKLLNYFI